MITNLYVKTNYSLLSSLIPINKLIDYCIKNNIKEIAICDNDLTSCKIFYNECKKNNIKPIIGLDLKYSDKNILLYAKNFNGYKNLVKLSTISSERSINIEDLKKYNNDLIIIIPFESKELYSELKDIYKDLYIGFSNIDEEKHIKNINKVFINKVLYFKKEEEKYMKYLLMIKDGKTLIDNVTFTDNYNYFLKDEIYNLSSSEGINNTQIIANKCNFEFPDKEDLLPVYDENINPNEYLMNLSIKGLNKRLNDNVNNIYKERLLYELSVIKQMGFSNYFLVVYDFIRYAKKNNILVGPGRGSAAGSLVAYSLGITEVDPIKYDLLFERFLNKERITMPDIDTDFPDIYREQVINYVKEKYGDKKVSGIITFGTMAPKLALRDVGRVLNIPIKTIDMLCKHIPNVTKLKLKDFYKNDLDFKNLIDSSDKSKLLFEISSYIEGFPRHTSVHAAGIVMSNRNLDELVPLIKNDDMYISSYTMEYLEEMGLLKMDFLGLKNLTTIMNIISDIEKHENIKIDFSKIPLDDKETLKIFENADTCGIFQFESIGMKDFLRKLKPNSLDDLFAAIALFRPGPSQNIDLFIRRKQGKEKIEYIDDSLIDILKPTNGIIIYQEQIMQIAKEMAGFTLSEADLLRRAISKKKIEILKNEEDKFINGCLSRGYNKEVSKKVFDLILSFADYGFNKSHSVAYTIIAYKMAYLKAKYPKYFFSNLLSSVIGNESKTLEYINEARKLNINILLPDINKSMNIYTVEEKGIRFPLSNIKSVGVVTCNDIIKNRNELYTDIYDCFSKILSRNVNKATLESLIYSSSFDSFNYNKKTLIENLDNLINYAQLSKDLDPDFIIKPEVDLQEEFSKDILLKKEKEIFGFYLSNHPTTLYKAKYNDIVNLEDIEKHFNKNINVIALIERYKFIDTKNNEKMCFLTGSDETNQMDFTLFPKTYSTYNDVNKGEILLINGNVQKRFDKYQIVVNKIEKL